MRQKENRPGAGDAYGTVPYNCINDITDICESQSIAYDDLLEAVTLAYLSDIDTDLSPDFSTVKVELLLLGKTLSHSWVNSKEPLNKSPSFSAERENRRLPLGSSDSVGK